MYPRLPLIGMPTYGLMVALGFIVALLLAERLGRGHGFGRGVIQDIAVWAALWGLIGAKVLLIALEPRDFLDAPWRVLFEGGVFYGGLMAAIIAVLVRCWRAGLDAHAVGDVCAPALALGHAFGRVGCFLAGCCWGRACTLPWAVHFTDPRSVPAMMGWPPSLGVHPTQLYESAGNLALMGLALALLARRRFVGQAWWTYVLGYALLRIGIETFRGDPRGTVLGGAVSTSQLVGGVAAVVAIVMLAVLGRRARRARAGEPRGEGSAPVPAARGTGPAS